jgi:putative hemolysin
MQLDLEPIKMKLMHVASGEGWSLEKANAVEKEYRRFLCLMKMYPDENTAPLVDVDTFWHYHILDTMKYAADCQKAFGYFLHHYPYVGMGDEDDEQFRLDSGDRMRVLYEATFGEAYPGTAAATERAQADADTAFCASPHVTATAFCASPHGKDIAFCASPHGKDIAFCASPHTRQGATQRAADMQTDTAFCASPHGKDIAFCASPHVAGKTSANA